jgi:hypothetical protein
MTAPPAVKMAQLITVPNITRNHRIRIKATSFYREAKGAFREVFGAKSWGRVQVRRKAKHIAWCLLRQGEPVLYTSGEAPGMNA